MKSSKKSKSGSFVLILMVFYVLLLGFATMDDILGWGILQPLFIG